MELFKSLLSPDFMPHGYCYLWDPRIVWLNVISDSLITLSYYCIPVVLIYFIRKRRDLPFNWIFWMFGSFILACGTTHLMEVWNIWHASYLVSGVLKAVTAIISVATAVRLIPLLPQAVGVPNLMQLQERTRKLEQEIAARVRLESPIDAPLKRKVTAGFVIAIVLTVVIGFASWHGARLATRDAYWASHTYEVMETIERMSRHVIETETSARAFALSGQEPLLVHYQTARDTVFQDKDALRHLTADNPTQQQRLDALEPQLRVALEFAESIIAKRRRLQAYPGGSDALEIERLMDVVRTTTREMRTEEMRLLSERRQKAQAGQLVTVFIAIVGAFLAAGLWGMARYAVNREIDASARARAQVNTLNAELEQRVGQRTSALQSEIAERKRADEAVKASLATSKAALKELADQKFALDQHAIVAVTDVQGTITYVNDKFCAISQYSKKELIGQNHRILNSGHHSKDFFQQMYHSIANGMVWHGEIKNRAKDGSIYWVDTTIVPFMGEDGKPRQYVAIRADISERKRVEEAVKESLAASKAVLKELADQKFALDQHAIVAITDVQGTITYVNDKFCAISQYSKKELIGQNHRILNSGHHSKDFFQQMYHSIANGKVWHGEIKNRAKDGSIYWVDTTIVPFVGEDGKPRQYVAIRADITERKRAEEVRERLAAVVESSDDAIIGKTLDGTITAWNRGAEKVFGYSASEAIGKPMLMLLPPERAQEEPDILARIARGESVEHFETVRIRKDGTEIHVSATISPIRDSSGVVVGASKIARDITEHKRAEQAVKESLATREAALQELADQKFALDQHAIVAVTDVQGTITYVNDKFCAISQYSEEELIGQNHRILNSGHHSKEFFQEMYHTIANGKVWHGEIKNRAKDGSIYWVDTTIVPFVGADGKPRQYVAIRADITERKRVEDAIKESLVATTVALKELADQKFALDQHAIVAVTDVQGAITYVNDKFCAISKYSKRELIGQNHRILNSDHHPKEFFQQMYRSIANGKVWHGEIKNRAKDGSIYWVDTTIVPFVGTDGKPRQYVAIRADITERKLAEEALREQARILDLAQVMVRDAKGSIALWNLGAEKLYGFTREEAIGRTAHELLQTKFPEPLEQIERQLEHTGTWEGELVHRKRDGNYIAVASVWVLHRDAQGQPLRILVSSTDITERRRAEAALRESEERFQAMANGIPQLAWMAEADGSIIWYNQRWYEYTGTGLEQMQGWGWQSVHDPEVLSTVLEGWKAAIEEGKPFEMEFPLRGADGYFRMFLTRVMPVRDPEGRVVRWFGTNTDISERQQSEERLARQAEELANSRLALESQTLMLKSVLDSMTEGLAAVDEQGKFVIWNTAAEKILGMGATELPNPEWTGHYGLFLSDKVTPFPTEQLPVLRAVRGEVSTTEMFVRNHRLPQGAWIEVSAGPRKDADGGVCGGVAAFRDITQRKADEQEIRKLNDELEQRVVERTAQLETANKELESFSYSVSHDLRAPLRHIGGFSKMLVEEFGPTLDPTAQHYLDRIQTGTQKMGLLVDELLNLARVGRHAVNRQASKLNSIVAEVIAVLQPEAEGRQVEWVIADLPAVECDPVLVRQIFQNLLANALKFTRPRADGNAQAGETAPASPTVIEVNYKEVDGQAVFMVRDNGVGFNMKYVNKLFGVFQRLHRAEEYEGTGIGLATVQRIVQKHGGRVWAEGEPDKGATFYFTLGVGKQTESKNNAATAGGHS